MIKDHIDRWYMTGNNHIEKDYVGKQHVIWNFTIEDHIDKWYKTENIIAKDHNEGYHMIKNIAMQ